jgi:hypothetical protein
MQRSGGALLAAGWTAAIQLFFREAEKCKSSPISAAVYEKSELLHDRKCVRIFCLHQRHYILMWQPRGFIRPLGFFTLSTHLKHWRFLPKIKSEINTRRKCVFVDGRSDGSKQK